ncbi:MAG: ROK family transcriptional regulator [Armatimonadota bacterium]
MRTAKKNFNYLVLKKENSRTVLSALRTHGRMSRKEISELTKLSFPTVCRIVDELMSESILTEAGFVKTGNAKRRTVLLDIEPGGCWVLALEIGGSHIKAAAMDLAGNLHESVEQSLDNVRGEEPVAQAIVSTMNRLLKECEPKRGKPLAMGISCTGMVDSNLGIVKLSFNLDLNNFPIARIARQVCNIPATVYDNIISSTLAEAKLGHGRTNDSFAYIAIGVGVGGSFVINRELYPLAAISQFGMMIVGPEGDPDRFGGRSYLESIASGQGIAAAARRAIESGTKSLLTELSTANITAKDVAEAAKKGDKLALDIFACATNYLGLAIVNITNLFGITFFAISGGVSKSGDVFWNSLHEAVAKYEYWPGQIKLEPSVLNEDAAVLGAGFLALNKVFDPSD